MRVLVVGSGGREHALCWKLAKEAEVLAAPGNPGIESCGACFPVRTDDFDGLEGLCMRERPDLVVVGPEAPLIAGLADRLRSAGFAVFGPSAQAAQLEGSKAFAKEMMRRAGVPTAGFETFHHPDDAEEFARQAYDQGKQLAVKASGPALGKGVVVAATLQESLDAIRMMMVGHAFGDAGATVVLEERLFGKEFSLLTICSGERFFSLPVAQDYKRAHDGDRGPNTGGMGSHSPVPWLSEHVVRRAEEKVVAPILRQLAKEGLEYRGTLFSGIMVHEGQPYCLEYNVRFGDPETQSVMPRLANGFAEVLRAAALGEPLPPVSTLRNAAVTVVVASHGYPDSPVTGKRLDVAAVEENVLVFHAGTRHSNGELVTSGGRVAAVTAVAPSLEEARERAYRNVGAVRFEGAWYRSDIAAP